MTATPVLSLTAARGQANTVLPRVPMDLALSEGDFALIETPGTQVSAAFADLCMGLVPLASGSVSFLGRDWSVTPPRQADALRGHIGRLFHQSLRADVADVAMRVLLSRMYHTNISEAELRAEAATLALRFGLPGLPAGPGRLISESDLLRASCVRTFLGDPRLIILELPPARQQGDFLTAMLEAGAEARGGNATVLWLVNPGPALRDRSIRPSWRLRLSDAGLIPIRQPQMAA